MDGLLELDSVIALVGEDRCHRIVCPAGAFGFEVALSESICLKYDILLVRSLFSIIAVDLRKARESSLVTNEG